MSERSEIKRKRAAELKLTEAFVEFLDSFDEDWHEAHDQDLDRWHSIWLARGKIERERCWVEANQIRKALHDYYSRLPEAESLENFIRARLNAIAGDSLQKRLENQGRITVLDLRQKFNWALKFEAEERLRAMSSVIGDLVLYLEEEKKCSVQS